MKTFGTRFLLSTVVILFSGIGVAQFRPRDGRGFRGAEDGPVVRTEGGQWVNEDTVRTARKDNMGWSGWEKFGNLTTYENEHTEQ